MWGAEKWGELIWGGHAVPGLSIGMLGVLMGCCFLAGGYFLRPGQKSRRGTLAAAILCRANGPLSSWDQASSYCWDTYRAHLCSPQQWRDAVCFGGLASPGASWTNAQTGTSTAGAIAACTTDGFASISTASQRVAACCAEWPRY